MPSWAQKIGLWLVNQLSPANQRPIFLAGKSLNMYRILPRARLLNILIFPLFYSNMDNESLVIDTNFIGSSQNSRTYAGTVRSKKCSVLATSKISDTCQYCAGLHGMVINRSVLSSPKKATRSLSQESTSSSASTSSASNNNSGNHPQQQSVWKLESSR